MSAIELPTRKSLNRAAPWLRLIEADRRATATPRRYGAQKMRVRVAGLELIVYISHDIL